MVVEEKYGQSKTASSRPPPYMNGQTRGPRPDSPSDSESSSESEDDEGELATQQLDGEIAATLQAIRSKDPRVYDKKATFYEPGGVDDVAERINTVKKDKPVYLQEYHRRNLLAGTQDEDEPDSKPNHTVQNEAQNDSLIRQMHETVDPADSGGSDAGAEDFFTAKPGQERPKDVEKRQPIDPVAADNDPETFLSNFMASRAWVPADKAVFHPFESDEEEEDDRADEYEEAYNLRFEDPSRSNEKLLSHSRQAAAQYSVRREEPKGRKRARDEISLQKEAARKEREEEKARLRNLRVEQATEKLKRFKEASGLRNEALPVEDWQKFLDAGWDTDTWDQEMQRRFGDQYYARQDDEGNEGSQIMESKKKRKLKKPKWSDDIDIDDIVPDFEQADDADFSLSESEEEEAFGQGVLEGMGRPGIETEAARPKKKAKSSQQIRAETKKEARKERRKLDEAVEQKMAIDVLPATYKNPSGPFRYRDTSPSAFGLSARDILMADDSSLNQYAGLKKLATFRDPDRKQKDKRKLGKKGRLRQWRKETFGQEEGPNASLQDFIKSRMRDNTSEPTGARQDAESKDDADAPARKKKRSRKTKAAESPV